MKKIFACSNGIEFFSNGESVVGTLSKEDALGLIAKTALFSIEIEDHQGFDASLKLLATIKISYIQVLPAEITITT